MFGRIFAVAAIVIILFGAVGAFHGQYTNSVRESQPATQIANETFDVNTTTIIELEESNQDVVYNDSVTVEQNQTIIQPSGNYTWYANNGTFDINASTTMNTSETANATYGYHSPANEQKLARDIGLIPTEVLGGALVELGGLVLLLGAVVILARMGGA